MMPVGSSRSNSSITNSVRPKPSSSHPDLEITSTRHKSLRSFAAKHEGSSSGESLETIIKRLKLQQLRQERFENLVKTEKIKKKTAELDAQLNQANETLKVIKLQSQLLELATLTERHADTLELGLEEAQKGISYLNMSEVEMHEGCIREALDLYQDLIKHTILH